ncbi:DMT family transporter [Rubrivirga sp. S365]|uniref:DMT family transporter n=1 Tax=Rubrivirga sp. S365 TaxID=3076080 RepID=UPI0028C525AE|nr:DMT family transporter [Rubrivirga sp. S365]MDT7857786.1 DMT family transporter [Rubrivirga sp. S365]
MAAPPSEPVGVESAGRGGDAVPPGIWALLALALVAVGTSPILVRLAGDVPALALAAWRTVFVSVLLVPVAAVRVRGEIRALPRRDVGLIAVAGVFLGLHFMAWITSVQLTSVASASVLVTLSPVFIVILGAVFLHERPDRRTAVAIAAAVAGAALIGATGGDGGIYPDPLLGNALALLAAFLVAVYLLISRSVRQRTSFLATFVPLNTAAALTCLAVCVALGVPLGLPLPALALAFALGIGPGLVGHGSFSLALRYVTAALIGLLTLAEPVISTAIAFAWFGERPAPLAFVGMAVVLAAISAVVVGRASPEERGKRK